MWRKSEKAKLERCVIQRLVWGQPPSAVRPGAARHFAAGLLLLLGLLPLWALSEKPSPPKPTEDLPAGTMQAKATSACLECHEARIILQQRLSKPAWAKEVDKMTKWGAVVDPADRGALIDYLSVNFSPDQPAYQAPRTAPVKAEVRTTKK